MKVLVLHGPNMNLVGLRNKEKITLDRINRLIKKQTRHNQCSAKIFQTNSQSRAINIISQNRNKCEGVIITPESWCYNGHGVAEVLKIIKKPYVCIHTQNKQSTVMKNAIDYVYGENILESYRRAIKVLLTHVLAEQQTKKK